MIQDSRRARPRQDEPQTNRQPNRSTDTSVDDRADNIEANSAGIVHLRIRATGQMIEFDLDQLFRRWLQDVLERGTAPYWRREAVRVEQLIADTDPADTTRLSILRARLWGVRQYAEHPQLAVDHGGWWL